MQLISVNIGQAQPIKNAKKIGKTGIYKQPVSEPVPISANGLPSDAICDVENHGGVDQAVYVFGAPDYAWWSENLGVELAPGTFGENLTISDLESAQFSIGDRLHIGAVILEVTAPRIPCVTLAVRMNDPAFLKRFRAAERPGLYCRVIQTGVIQVGDRVEFEPYAGETITAIEMFRDFYTPHLNVKTVRRHLAAPIAIRDRVAKEALLQELLAQN
ncbi:MAG: MOSC domain-containing protein [Chloroflexi bacterium]|nr:MOSC domain-containing protein [Chloroflexota bacterium]